MTDTVAIFYDKGFMKYDLGPGHPLHQDRILLHHELSKTIGLLDTHGVSMPEFSSATEEYLRLVHSTAYIDQVRILSTQEGYTPLDREDTPAFPGAFDAARLLVGASLAAADTVMQGKADHSWNPGGGLHHAHADRAAGFCIFNDVAITCHHLKRAYKTKRILYLDIDVHHGDGVQEQFYSDPSVLTLSIHQTGRTIFPESGFSNEIGEGEGLGYSVNVPLPPYTNDQQYLEAFEAIVPPIIEAFKPEVIVMQNGVDTHYQDQLGNLILTTHAFEAISSRIHDLVHRHSHGRLIAVGGGGYSYYSVPRCWTLILANLIGVDVSDTIPLEWQNLFGQVTGLKPPIHLRDHEGPSLSQIYQDRIGRLVRESVNRTKDMVFPLLGIEK
ncbi:MAG: acetoin utilization protein AcuC [Candidatus Hodarchaeota archaeon]